MSILTRLCWVTALAIVLSSPTFAQLGILKGKGDPKEQKEKKTEAKNVAKYEKLKQYSKDKYDTDPDFKDEVEEAYENLLRDHGHRAYQKNTQISSRIVSVREDRWRVHENLYDNLLVQDHINRIGQRLVSAQSERTFAFKVIPDPAPLAETLATGTIYISTGLISMLDSEAQLAYVLAHEAGHVEKNHWHERVMLDQGQKAYAEDQAKKTAGFRLMGSLLGAGLGAASGQGTAQKLEASFFGGSLGDSLGAAIGALVDRPLIVDWDTVEEDEADDFAFKATLDASYDVREVPNLYASMQKVAVKDVRVGLGFLGSRRRIDERLEHAKNLIANAYKREIDVRLKAGFLSTTAEHRNLMAELKRDNGIMAYYHDMFELARVNLKDAVAIRDNDPAAHYYYAKVLKQIGRTDEDRKLAEDEFYKAVKFDVRDENFGSHLHLAMMMAREKNPDRNQVTHELDDYVTDYARWTVMDRTLRAFPPNLETVYEYMTLYGDPGWRPKAPDVKDLPQAYQQLNSVLSSAPPEAAPAPAAKTPAPADSGSKASPLPNLPVSVPGIPKKK
jgi:predicted Zn-dependent protease